MINCHNGSVRSWVIVGPVHSLKDMATQLPDGLGIVCHLPRADPRDAFVSARAKRLLDLPQGAMVGSSALRRQAQILRARPDLRVVPLRGNVETRLGKVSDGKVDATLLALAGLARLGLEDRITEILSTDLMLPAPAQGTIAVEARAGDDRVLRYLAPLDDSATAARSAAERALLAALDGSCRTPIAALAEIESAGRLRLQARIIRPDGTQCHEARLSGAIADAARIGREIQGVGRRIHHGEGERPVHLLDRGQGRRTGAGSQLAEGVDRGSGDRQDEGRQNGGSTGWHRPRNVHQLSAQRQFS